MSFKDYCYDGKCDVCGTETKVVAHASTMGSITCEYCEECHNKVLEPYDIMVTYISCAGRFPDDINENYRNLCRNILKELNISEEQFIKDVDAAIKEMDDEYESFCQREINKKTNERTEF